ncbi:reverse transcriptase domain-containing protein [Bacillus cereus]|uniref:reverse transcriptase domain-containing protein n=1 Tax=Bacillus cereus TaxID=1396 RepID=UPI0021121E18|nr:reverse transcriptase domain-containing protein [Bacillus cereus]
MRCPQVVLENLASKSNQSDYQYKRLYRNLYNEEFYLLAYENLYPKLGNMTRGIDNETIDGMSLEKIKEIINNLRNRRYQPIPVRRVQIPKKNGNKTRPIGVPSFKDKLVQEVIRMILESIYEGKFSSRSHSFRPNKSCHTALEQVKVYFQGTKWFIEGDISSFFDNISHKVLINILKKTIEDVDFIELINKFLKAGYIENWTFHRTYSGTPQGGVLSPILSNIYLNELDKYMKIYKEKFDKGQRRKRNPKYRGIEKKLRIRRNRYKHNWNEIDQATKLDIIQQIKQLKKEQLLTLPLDPMDANYRRIQYVRYADDFIISVIGSKEDCKIIKQDIANFLEKELNLQLSQEKTLITHGHKKARFLGYDITICNQNGKVKNVKGTVKRTMSGTCILLLPHEVWRNKLLDYKAIRINHMTGEWKPIHRPHLLGLNELEILNTYNAEIRGIYNYYKLAQNVYKLQKFSFFMEYSLYKTLAGKYKSSVRKIINKYKINGHFGICYKTKAGNKVLYFYNDGFKRQTNVSKTNKNVDQVPNTLKYRNPRSSLVQRLLANKCEWCSTENIPIEIHHIKKLKDLKGKKQWEIAMISRKRKTMALCKQCHFDLHQGKLD